MTIIKKLMDYSQNVANGKITACQKYKWACLRFMRDIERIGTGQWVFNEEKAEAYLKWMRLFKHSRGELAGMRKEPCDYEMFVYGNIYGWHDKDTGLRRYNRVYEQLARKQAKSQNKAIQALYEISAFGEPNAEAYVAATKKEQTRFVWQEAEWLFKNSILKNKFTCKYDQGMLQKVIKHVASGSTFSRLSKDDKKSGDGANPHFVILDEYHLHDTPEYLDLAVSGMKTRRQPLLSIITTAGFNLDYPCFRSEYSYVSKILDPNDPVENDRYFVVICELDRNNTHDIIITPDGREIEPGGIIDKIGSDEAILKSNPVTGMSATVRNSIIQESKEAIDNPEKMRNLMTKTYNVWVQSRPLGYMDMTRWAACKVPQNEFWDCISRKAAGRCYIGFDLSAKIDLTSISFVFTWTENGAMRYAIKSHSFIPEDKFAERMGTDKVPYDVWRKDGFITVTDGAVIDYKRVIKYVYDQIEDFELTDVEYCTDPWSATALNNDLMDDGKTVVEIRQGLKTLAEPTKAFREAVYARHVMHDGDPVLSWAVGNAVTRADHNGNIMLDKSKATQRIDPIAATITAFVRAMTDKPEQVVASDSWGGFFV